MVLLPLPQSPFARLRLLVHESFHRLQGELGLRTADRLNPHLDTESGRLWLRMELRALAQALRSDNKGAQSAASDAMLFRSFRQSLHPSAAANEAALEIAEGLAEYTGTALALLESGESLARVARDIESFEDRPSYARSFAYATGPALGLLLDRLAGGWRKTVKPDTILSVLLRTALRFRTPADVEKQAKLSAERYGYRAVAAHERERELRFEAQLAQYRARFLDGPTLRFSKTPELRRVFNPSNLVTLEPHGTVYPTGTFSSAWGKLQVDAVGALLSPDNTSLRVVSPADPSARPLTGPGWRLELAPGWTVRPAPHPGDFEVVSEK